MTRRISLIGGSVSFAILLLLNALGSCQAKGGEPLQKAEDVESSRQVAPDGVERAGTLDPQRLEDEPATFSNSATERIVIRRPSRAMTPSRRSSPNARATLSLLVASW